MGGNSSRSRLSAKSKVAKVVFLGLNGSGKTSIIDRLAGGKVNQLVPTRGHDVVQLEHDGFHVTVLDVGGSKSDRAAWAKFCAKAHACVFVIDAADRKRMEETGVELEKLLRELDEISGMPLLVFANKQDSFSAASAKELSEGLNLHLIRGRVWQIQQCSAKTGEGLQMAFEWLMSTIAESVLPVKDLKRGANDG